MLMTQDARTKMSRKMFFRSLWTALLVVVLACCAGSAVAQTGADRARANAIAAQGKKAFVHKEFDAAAELYLQAYELSKVPLMLFNAARAKQEARKYLEARDLFRVYKNLPKIGLENYRAAEEKILECDHELAIAEAAKTPPPIVGPHGEEPQGEGVVVSVEVTPTVGRPELMAAARITLEPRKLVSWQSGTGVGLAIAGIALMVSGASATSEANELPTTTRADQQAYREAFSNARTRWGIGAAACALGVGFSSWGVAKSLTFGPDGAVFAVKF